MDIGNYYATLSFRALWSYFIVFICVLTTQYFPPLFVHCEFAVHTDRSFVRHFHFFCESTLPSFYYWSRPALRSFEPFWWHNPIFPRRKVLSERFATFQFFFVEGLFLITPFYMRFQKILLPQDGPFNLDSTLLEQRPGLLLPRLRTGWRSLHHLLLFKLPFSLRPRPLYPPFVPSARSGCDPVWLFPSPSLDVPSFFVLERGFLCFLRCFMLSAPLVRVLVFLPPYQNSVLFSSDHRSSFCFFHPKQLNVFPRALYSFDSLPETVKILVGCFACVCNR